LISLSGCEAESQERAVFERDVVPVLERHCTSDLCHGVTAAGEASGEVIEWERLFFRVDAVGTITDVDAAYETAKRAINTLEDPAFSSLLRKPLAQTYGGQPHHGLDNFRTPRAAGYVAIRDWIAMEFDGGEDPEPLTELEERFEQQVQPVLVGASCLNANCHGPSGSVPLRFDPGVGGEFPIEATRANYEEARSMLSVDGHATQSRLLAKSLPLHDGGIVHKGGNAAFLPDRDDPRAHAITSWACAEREALTGLGCNEADAPPVRGFVFVRGPLGPGDPFELDHFTPGTDLFYARVDDDSLVPAEIVNLTEDLHDNPVDIRDPAVSADGTRVAFAMRESAGRGHALYEFDLDSEELSGLTDAGQMMAAGGLWTDRDPTYGPEGHVWFVSTRGGTVADRGSLLDADIYELDPGTGDLTRRTFTPHVERKPVYYTIGAEAGGEIGFTALRDAVDGVARAHPFRFPPALGTEYHQHFGITPKENLFHDTRELANGNYVVTVGDLTGVWAAGQLGVIDRNFGPEINDTAADETPALPGYTAPLIRLDPDAAAIGVTAGMYRDAVGLPDGRVLVAYAPGPMDLSDPMIIPDFGIEVLELDQALDSSGPFIADRQVVVDEVDTADFDPEPIYVRASTAPIEEPQWDPEQPDGYFHHLGVPVIDALLTNLFPSGSRPIRDDFAYIRIVESLPFPPNHRTVVPPEETLDGVDGATTCALGQHGPARILAELPLGPDGSFHAKLPAGVPFRLQGLDARRMAIGTMHNRWYYVAPGQTIRQGLADADLLYAPRCAACHGSLDGDPDHAFEAPDVMTMASVTHARFENRDPRRPTQPLQLGADTVIEIDYRETIRPLVQRSCAVDGCHSSGDAAGGLNLSDEPTQHFSAAYENLLSPGVGSGGGKRYVDDGVGSARRSHLIERLLGEELDAPRQLDVSGVPHPGPDDGVPVLSDEEVLTFVRWIELGATWIGTTGGSP
jgi:hypothetical protein